VNIDPAGPLFTPYERGLHDLGRLGHRLDLASTTWIGDQQLGPRVAHPQSPTVNMENAAVPVVRIRALPQPQVDVRAVAIAVADALAAELGAEPRGTWVTWETVDVYAEGGVAPGEQPRDTHPPIATILAGARPPDVVARMLRAVGDALVRELGLEPGNVFVTLEEVDPDRLYDASG
jgi:phenylpyruvate tautomerase PptA (4-oxalocrotonate tautomerase family)